MKNKKIVLTIIGLSLMAILGAAVEAQAYAGISEDFSFTKTLKTGMSDSDVVYLKKILTAEGCLSSLFTSPIFGSQTLTATQCFCNKYKAEISEIVGYNVNCSGIVGTGLRAKLNNLLAIAPGTSPTPTYSPSPTPTITPSFTPTLNIVSPNGGEKWQIGNTYNITWQSTGVNNVALYFCLNSTWGFNCYKIADTNGYLKKYSWYLDPSNRYLQAYQSFKIKIADLSNLSLYDLSDNYFSIVSSISNHSPGSTFIGGTYETSVGKSLVYYFNSTDLEETSKLSFSISWGDGITGSCVATSVRSDGAWECNSSHSWSVSGTYTITAFATDSQNASSTAVSNGFTVKVFSIYPVPTPTPTPTTGCTDSDGGNNYYIKGTITGIYSDLNSSVRRWGSWTDYCNSDVLGSGWEGYLTEYSCAPDNYSGGNATGNYGWTSSYKCPYGCKNGACLSTPVPSPTPTTTALPSPPTLYTPSNGIANITLTPSLDWSDTISYGGWYHLYYKKSTDYSWSAKNGLPSSQYSFSASEALSPNTNYQWQVRACNSSYDCSDSTVWSFTTVSSTPTPTPTPTCTYSLCQYSNAILPCKCGSSNTAMASSPYCCATAWNGFITNSKATCDANCGTQTCSETDGGQALGTKGTLTFGGNSYTDYCQDSTYVYEYYCSGNTFTGWAFNCQSYGYNSCSNGVCTSGGSTPTPTSTGSCVKSGIYCTDSVVGTVSDHCSGSTSIYWTCSNGSCQYNSQFCPTGCSATTGRCNSSSGKESQLASVFQMINNLIKNFITGLRGLFK